MKRGDASRLVWVAPFVVAMLLLAPMAEAHLVTTGLGPLYDGISHFLVSFEDLLPVAAMALLAGMNGARAGRRALFLLPSAWVAGGLVGLSASAAPLSGAWVALSAVVLGALVAADRRLPPGLIAALAMVLGVLHGWLNGAGIAAANREGVALLGIGGAVFVVVSLLAGLAASLRSKPSRIAVRVAGSWIGAVGILMAGWQLGR